METLSFTGARVTVPSTKTFEEVTAAILSLTGRADLEGFKKLVETKASASQVEGAVARMAGKSGFMIFAEIPQGPLMSLIGKTKKATLFLVGNPLIANQMFEHDPAVGLYVPLRLYVFSDYSGKTYIAYDRPSSLLCQFKSEPILAIAKMLDRKFDELATMTALGPA